ncbi:MAG: four-helix bundle copper-binding protein [Phycisphaerales bacterium]
MIRRNAFASLLCTAALVAAGFAVYSPVALGQPAEKQTMAAMSSDQREACITMSAACAAACGKASEYCTNMAKNGKGEHAAMAALASDCGACCASCLAFVSRNSQLSPAMCECCAKCCDQCAAACDKVDGQAMKDCAKACRDCAAACRAMGK